MAIEYALKKPNTQIRFAAPTAKALRKIIHPIFSMLCADAPEAYRPQWTGFDALYRFHNGSEIHVAGTDKGNAESLRGTSSHLNIIDEAGFCSELDYVLRSILMPQTITTGGTTIMASTPPKTPAHDFFEIAQECKQDGHYQEFTIYDNETLTPDIIDIYAKESGGYESTTFQREYLCKFVVDTSSAVIPEWDAKFIGHLEPTEFTGYYHRYTALDIGVRDFTAGVLGYYDFRRAVFYVEHEFQINGPEMTTPKLAELIKATEAESFQGIKPYRRIADNNNLILLQDLGTLHDMHFAPTSKDSLHAMVNELRILVGNGRIMINPRCTKTIGAIQYAVWDDHRKEFARSKTYGHFDHLAALIYLVRNLDQTTNPIPATHNVGFDHFYDDSLRKKKHDTFKKALLGGR